MPYKTDIDYEYIEGKSIEELLPYIHDNFVSEKLKNDPTYFFKRRYKMMLAVCTMLKIVPSPEQWVFLLSDAERMLCEACAGAGKTTMAQLKLVDAKLTRNTPGKNILALAYNNHAVKDMLDRHEEIMTRINAMKIPGLMRDREICCSTFHSFCMGWVQDYPERFGINPKNYLLADSGVHEAMRFAADAYAKKNAHLKLFISDAIITALISLYTFSKETLTRDTPESWPMCSAYNDLNEIPLESIQTIFNLYENLKRLKKSMDFADVIDRMYELCLDPEVIARLRANYSIMLVDEYQDITPAMLRVIKAFMEGTPEKGIPPYVDGHLICIGDGDQSIYGFRGTDPDNCIRFRETYNCPDYLNCILSMSENRRCPSEIIKVARRVIESNDKRIDKPIRSIRDGGEIKVVEYFSQEDQMSQLVRALKAKPEEDLRQTCVCYRNLSSSYMLTIKLIEAGIPFRFGKGHMPLTDKLSASLFDVFNMLSYPDNLAYIQAALYKVVPKSAKFTKTAISELLKIEEDQRKRGGDLHRFWELEFDFETKQINGFVDAMKILHTCYIHQRRNEPMSRYVPYLIKLIRQYYLNWQLQRGTVLSEEYLEYINSWFSRSEPYSTFITRYRKLRDELKENQIKGVYLTTLHGLKGLEFDDVYIIDLDDGIFPGTELNQSRDLSQAQKDILENEARRLFYVAVTRTRDKLTLYFNHENPTRYIRFFKVNVGLANTYESYITQSSQFVEQDGFLVASSGEEKTSMFGGTAPAVQQVEPIEESDDLLDLDVGSTDILESTLPDAEVFPEIVEDALDSAEAINEVNAGKPGAVDREQFESVMDSSGTVEEQLAREDERDQRLSMELGEKNYQSIADKPGLRSVLDLLLDGGK